MLKKIFAAAICGVVIASMSSHADAAGPAGFTRHDNPISHSAVGLTASDQGSDGYTMFAGSCASDAQLSSTTLTDARRDELFRVNTSVNASMNALDDFFTSFDETASAPELISSEECADCATIKRRELIDKGWSARTLRIAYTLTEEGDLETVLIVQTSKGDIVLGNGAHKTATKSRAIAL
jgi:predicted transglutaminase-like cysteine proteinase